MNKFLVISVALLVIALTLTGIVFFYVSFMSPSNQSVVDIVPVTNIDTPVTSATPSATALVEIPLRDLSISDTQQEMLESVGIEVDTFVITPAMQDCAVKKLSVARVAEIVAGATPSALEIARLVPCLSAE